MDSRRSTGEKRPRVEYAHIDPPEIEELNHDLIHIIKYQIYPAVYWPLIKCGLRAMKTLFDLDEDLMRQIKECRKTFFKQVKKDRSIDFKKFKQEYADSTYTTDYELERCDPVCRHPCLPETFDPNPWVEHDNNFERRFGHRSSFDEKIGLTESIEVLEEMKQKLDCTQRAKYEERSADCKHDDALHLELRNQVLRIQKKAVDKFKKPLEEAMDAVDSLLGVERHMYGKTVRRLFRGVDFHMRDYDFEISWDPLPPAEILPSRFKMAGCNNGLCNASSVLMSMLKRFKKIQRAKTLPERVRLDAEEIFFSSGEAQKERYKSGAYRYLVDKDKKVDLVLERLTKKPIHLDPDTEWRKTPDIVRPDDSD